MKRRKLLESVRHLMSSQPENWPEFDTVQDLAYGTSLEVLLTEFEDRRRILSESDTFSGI